MGNPNPNTSGLMPPFSSTNQPNNPGRKPSSVKKYIKDNGLNYNDVSAMAKHIIPLTEEEVKALEKNKEAPFMLRLFAKAIRQDLERGYLDNIMKILERAVGKPHEKHQIEAEVTNITREEREARIKELLNKADD